MMYDKDFIIFGRNFAKLIIDIIVLQYSYLLNKNESESIIMDHIGLVDTC